MIVVNGEYSALIVEVSLLVSEDTQIDWDSEGLGGNKANTRLTDSI